jgi:hypothetical protein
MLRIRIASGVVRRQQFLIEKPVHLFNQRQESVVVLFGCDFSG